MSSEYRRPNPWSWHWLYCRYLWHPLWYRPDGGIWCYREGKVVGRWS